MFEITVHTMAIDVGATSDEQQAAGMPPQVMGQIIGGTVLPFQGPDGNPVQYPSISVNFNLNREAALKMAEKLKEEAERLPETKRADILVPKGGMGEVEQIA